MELKETKLDTSVTSLVIFVPPVTGIVGDVVLNHSPLRGFSTFCLEMKPGFMRRFVG